VAGGPPALLILLTADNNPLRCDVAARLRDPMFGATPSPGRRGHLKKDARTFFLTAGEPFCRRGSGTGMTSFVAGERQGTASVAVEAFDDFYRDVWPDLSAYARSLSDDDGAGDELAQEALTRIFVRWRALRAPRPYAFRIVTNLARDRWRAKSRERATWQALAGDQRMDQPDSQVLDAVQRLKRPHREVLLLHYWADLTVEEVAKTLRRPSGTVKRRLSEGRKALAATLDDREAGQ
jgi:RNA polymerase sigma-70 factor (ECF subfamily)